MNIAFYNGVSGLIAYQNNLNVLSHNMANVNTTGYKETRTSFSDLLYTNMNVHHNYQPEATKASLDAAAKLTGQTAAEQAADPNAVPDPNAPAQAQTEEQAAAELNRKYLVGHGVKGANLDLLYTQGNLVQTNFNLDFAIVGDGFFAVDREGVTEYTRNGALDISLEGKKGYLVTTDGAYVLDAKGKKIQVPYKANTETFNLEGLTEKIGVYNFSNPYGLEQTTGSSFLATPISGEAKVTKIKSGTQAPYKLRQGALESSSVDVASEMVEVMTTQKAFQINSKIVQTADQIEEIINNLR